MRIPKNWYIRLLIALLLTTIAFIIRRYFIRIEIPLGEDIGLSCIMYLLIILVWSFFANINFQLDKYIPFDKNTTLRITIQIALGVALILFIRLTGLYSMRKWLPIEPEPIVIAVIIGLNIFLALTINLAVISHYLIQRWKESLVKTEKLEQERIQLQYNTLRNQVNPHFLFNSFASLQSMIHSNPVAATRYVTLLAKVYRYAIGNNEKVIVPLYKEIDMFNNYLEVMHLRYGKALTINMNIPEEAMEKGIVHMVMQNLVENAIKHNEVHLEFPLEINIEIDEQKILVTNTIKPRETMQNSNGDGLIQLQRLYQFYSKNEFQYGIHGNSFQVIVPLI